MGKSPAKWIKSVLLGKKTSRSSLSKGKDIPKTTSEKGAGDATNVEVADISVGHPSVTQPTYASTDRNGDHAESEEVAVPTVTHDEVALVPGSQDADNLGTEESVGPNDPERVREKVAATKAQAAFRGYLARRAFRALRGIIRLQALIRGHLVRRQAVATLCCLQGVVKLQALYRGKQVRHSDIGVEVRNRCTTVKLLDAKCTSFPGAKALILNQKPSRIVFVSKLLGSSQSAMPLHLQYSMDEPNSYWSWLERWTIFHAWGPLPRTKKFADSKSQKNKVNNVEAHTARSKRTVRKVPSNGSVHSSSESAKPKRNLRKVPNHSVDPAPEQPQNEVDKVKRNLRKVSNSTIETATNDQLPLEIEKPIRSVRKASSPAAPVVPEQSNGDCADKMSADAAIEIIHQSDKEIVGTPVETDQLDDVTHDSPPAVELPHQEIHSESENIPVSNGESISKEEDLATNENQKDMKRRSSFPAKQEDLEIGSPKTPKLPSYMQATQSAKAKLRGQGSPKIGHDGEEKSILTRRHSLSSSASNGKLSSASPRAQRLSSGKGGIKTDRSLSASKDEKVVQADWRR
ncbi:hypothetical protein MKW98_022871 [Papaver atlanticum]|uniref:DUF4005 domain-containing protein n=1 Tax=Papaver atlanticum TaxID=357466 RepID=A0AAD4TLR9_9MAGN|nr:hypothetical protein MKW98_022871 [Papaver atlanticum]